VPSIQNSPIADLTYRNYDGPLEAPLFRWWAIAKMSIRLSTAVKGFWAWAILSGFWYVILLIIFYFVDASPVPQTATQFYSTLVWKDQFENAFAVSQIFLFILALQIGAGTIANDNRANALLVYLSKPCSKLDYVIGKWLGIFLPMALVSAIPTYLFYGFCVLSYRSHGFLSQDPWLVLRLLPMVLVPGVFYASVTIGISSLFRQGRLAGAAFAGLYFFTVFFTKAMQALYMGLASGQDADGGSSNGQRVVQNLYYCAIDGIQDALAKIFLHTNGSPLLRGMPAVVVHRPSGWVFIPAFFAICAGSVFLAWTRIRAVEVVG